MDLQQTLSARSYLNDFNDSPPDDKKRGRPRLPASPNPSNAGTSAIQDRRSQIRRAQRTYRLKKETTLRNLQTRVSDLERTLHTVSGLLDDLHDVAACSEAVLPPSHRALLDQMRVTVDRSQSNQSANIPNPRQPHTTTRGTERELGDVFGYEISHAPSIYTCSYSYHESTFAHRLHRFSLEKTYSWLLDTTSPPAWIIHVFGLLPCLPDKNAVQRNYRRVLQAGSGESLEVRVLPFYSIGGAGMHYPRRDANGRPVYPENTRRPNRILGRAVNAMFGGDVGGQKEQQLQMLDFVGEWFDCHDVQGYLEHLGIELDCILSATVPAPTVRLLESIEWHEACTLDLERFLSALVQNTRILGRAPGYKKSDVDAALKSALQFT